MAQACAVGIITGCGAILYDELIQLAQGVALSSDELPNPDTPLHQEDALVLVGRTEYLRR